VAAAVGEHEGEVDFSDGGGCNAEARVGAAEKPGERTLRVPMTTLDRFKETHPKPTLVKVDVEGAEAAVIEGALHLLREGTTFLFEFHGPDKAADVVSVLRSESYRFWTLDGYSIAFPEQADHVVSCR
jgi:hypothetical protein